MCFLMVAVGFDERERFCLANSFTFKSRRPTFVKNYGSADVRLTKPAFI